MHAYVQIHHLISVLIAHFYVFKSNLIYMSEDCLRLPAIAVDLRLRISARKSGENRPRFSIRLHLASIVGAPLTSTKLELILLCLPK